MAGTSRVVLDRLRINQIARYPLAMYCDHPVGNLDEMGEVELARSGRRGNLGFRTRLCGMVDFWVYRSNGSIFAVERAENVPQSGCEKVKQ